MASNWRLNVADQGWSGFVIELAARVQGHATHWIVKLGPPLNAGLRVVFGALSSGQMTLAGIGGALSGHFPYGVAVDPD